MTSEAGLEAEDEEVDEIRNDGGPGSDGEDLAESPHVVGVHAAGRLDNVGTQADKGEEDGPHDGTADPGGGEGPNGAKG